MPASPAGPNRAPVRGGARHSSRSRNSRTRTAPGLISAMRTTTRCFGDPAQLIMSREQSLFRVGGRLQPEILPRDIIHQPESTHTFLSGGGDHDPDQISGRRQLPIWIAPHRFGKIVRITRTITLLILVEPNDDV